jgi:hypothetical protein
MALPSSAMCRRRKITMSHACRIGSRCTYSQFLSKHTDQPEIQATTTLFQSGVSTSIKLAQLMASCQKGDDYQHSSQHAKSVVDKARPALPASESARNSADLDVRMPGVALGLWFTPTVRSTGTAPSTSEPHGKQLLSA